MKYLALLLALTACGSPDDAGLAASLELTGGLGDECPQGCDLLASQLEGTTAQAECGGVCFFQCALIENGKVNHIGAWEDKCAELGGECTGTLPLCRIPEE